MNVNALSNRTSSTSESVAAKSSSVSPGKPDDEIRAECEIGNGVAERVDETEIAVAVVGAAHRLEKARRAGLCGQVDVLADARALSDGRDDGCPKVLRVGAREADPVDAGHRIACAEKLPELGLDLGSKVAPPRVDVLAEQRDLSNARVREACNFGDDGARSSALLAATDRRDDAVRARRVAAHRHLHPRVEAAFAAQRKVGGEMLMCAESSAIDCVPPGRYPFAEMWDRARTEGDIDEGVALEDALPLCLGVAAADRDHDVRALALERAGVAEVRGEARVGLLADRARVEHDDVGVLGRRRLPQAERFEHALDALGIVGVHLTAERRDVVAPHRVGRVARAATAPSAAARGARPTPPRRLVAPRRVRRRRSGRATFRQATAASRPST